MTDNQPITWRFLFNEAIKHRRSLWFANVFALVAVVLAVPIPLIMPLMVDEVLLDKPNHIVATLNAILPPTWHGAVGYIISVFVITVILRITFLILSTLHERIFTNIGKDIVYKMRVKLLKRLERISMSEYETLGSATVASHLVTDVETIDEFIGRSIARFIISVLSMIAIAGILLMIHWPLALFILCLNPAVLLFTRMMNERIKQWKKEQNSAFELFQQSLGDTLDAIQQLRTENREQHYINRVIGNAKKVKTTSANFLWKSEFASRFSFTIFLFIFDLFRAVSMLIVVFSDLSVGQMLAVFGYLWFMMTPVQDLINIQYSFFSAQSSMKRINTLLNLKEDPNYPQLKNPFENTQNVSVELKNIHFQYNNTEQDEDAVLLTDINLHAKAGETIGIVGSSGSGKSTLAQILLGMYTPQSGDVFFEGISVKKIGWPVVREHITSVLQAPALFNDTVRNNLTLGRDINDDALWHALGVAQIKDTIEALDNQLDTIIGRNGVRLSGGQRQRLAIARMMLSHPKLVILDEATSALDTRTEAKLHQALDAELRNTTTIVIAHRLSALKQADRIYVVDDGRISESGTHNELLNNGGLYTLLYGSQSNITHPND